MSIDLIHVFGLGKKVPWKASLLDFGHGAHRCDKFDDGCCRRRPSLYATGNGTYSKTTVAYSTVSWFSRLGLSSILPVQPTYSQFHKTTYVPVRWFMLPAHKLVPPCL